MSEINSKHYLYQTWNSMRQRCFNDKRPDYFRYGGRGIIICERWLKFENFVKDMEQTYKKGLSIDRIDNNGNYSKDNCRWATRLEQTRNTRNIERARKYTFKGITKSIREWAEYVGIKRSTLDMRLNYYGWPIERALLKGGKQL